MLRIAKAIHTIEGLKVLLIKIAFGNLYMKTNWYWSSYYRDPLQDLLLRTPLKEFYYRDPLQDLLHDPVNTGS